MPNEQKAGVLQGTLDLMVLQTLATLGPLHGYAIGARIEQVSGGAIQLNMGTLYPGLLRLEVTESVVVDNVDAAASTLARLKALGARVYLDDFGTGYSSLSSLHQLPIDALKVDRSFVSRIGEGGGEQMVRTVATIARNLELAVVAEGIETPEQLRLVRSLGCEYAQGYLFSPPLDPERLHELVEGAPRW